MPNNEMSDEAYKSMPAPLLQ